MLSDKDNSTVTTQIDKNVATKLTNSWNFLMEDINFCNIKLTSIASKLLLYLTQQDLHYFFFYFSKNSLIQLSVQ